MIKLLWAEPALGDLENIHDYIAQDSEHYATAFVNALIDAADILESHPKIGRIVPEYGKSNIREIIHEPYRIIYQLERDRVTILTIVHGRRMLASLGRE